MALDEHVILFLDILGFTDLTEANPTSIVREELGTPDNMVIVRTSPGINLFNAFHSIIEQVLDRDKLNGGISAMIFSDCAFLSAGPALRTALLATDLMRHFVKATVPVRMGIGFGTFERLRLSLDTRDDASVTRAMFYGTGVVRSHDAEARGGKGLRIFVHPKMEPYLGTVSPQVGVLQLDTATTHAKWELSYLHVEKHDEPVIPGFANAEELDKRLWTALDRMRARVPIDADPKVLFQYDETKAALNGMRQHAGRPLFNDLTASF